jgi:hypothetical protein
LRCLRICRFGFAYAARLALLTDAISELSGKVDQRFARKKHGDCGDDAGCG